MRASRVRGFSLLELLISAAIMTIITSIVIVRFTAFDSTVLLKSLAYEVATSIRDAQVYSLSVLNQNGQGYDYPYGVSFSSHQQTYTFFRYTGADTLPSADTATIISILRLTRSIEIADVCILANGSEYCNSDDPSTITRLDISFRRPEFKALFNVVGLPGGVTSGDIYTARVKLRSATNNSMTWVVEVGLLGQVSVRKE